MSNTEHVRITVAAPSRPYDVVIGEGSLERLSSLVETAGCGPRRFIAASTLVWRLHGTAMQQALPGALPILVPDGERFKTLQTLSRVYDGLVRGAADRGAVLVTFGGGVVGDLAGFAAATYMRGIDLVHVPTTLLAQVDAAIGGKVAVNHPAGKNLIGAFYQPRLVVEDPLVLATLARRDFRAGLYEIIKYGMACSAPLLDLLQRQLAAVSARNPSALVPLITESCRIKADVVSKDEREAGPRRVLNFGHTAAHAIESVTRYRRFRHGEAVAYGMLVAADVAVHRGALAENDRSALGRIIAQLGPLPPVADLSAAEVVAATRRDKKVVNETLHFVLPAGVGRTTIVEDVTEAELERALRAVGLRGTGQDTGDRKQ